MTYRGGTRDIIRTLAGQRPVVLTGRGHSGTRVLAYAVQSLGVDLGFAPRSGRGDPDDAKFRKQLAEAARTWDVSDDPPERRVRALRKVFASWLKRANIGEPWGWKYPESYLLTPHVHRIFPAARYVHIVRDGRDLAFKRHRTDDPTTKLGRAVLSKIGALNDPPHVRAAKSWAYQTRLFRDYAASAIPREQLHEVTFEGLCRDPVGETERIAAFLGLRVSDETREFLAGYINPQKISQFRSEDPAKIAEVERAIGDALREFGYAPSAPRPATTPSPEPAFRT